MFKGSAERQHFQRREGSHSTKGFANGRVDVLPPQARERETLYVEAKKQRESLERIASGLKAKLWELEAKQKNAFCKNRLKEIKRIHEALRDMASARANLAEVARSVGYDAYGWAFMAIAEVRLPREMFKEIDMECEKLIGRKAAEVKLPAGVALRQRRARQAERVSASDPQD